MPAKDKTPNRTLAVAIDLRCDRKDCYDHATITSTKPDGTIKRRCLTHLHTERIDPNAYLLKFLNLA